MPLLLRRAGCVMAAVWISAVSAAAQAQSGVDVSGEVFVNSEAERYLRILQVGGQVPLYPWSVRGFSVHEVERLAPADTAHPWAERYRFSSRRTALRALRVRAGTIYNTALPEGENDGAVWAGRGATAVVQAGFTGQAGPLTLTIAPLAFVTENREFLLLANNRPEDERFADPNRPGHIDLPQRFGDDAYGRIDPGQSTLRLDVAGGALGVSTANLHWGPAQDHPLILGSNAAGFPHLFVGSSRATDVGIGRLHGRVSWGVLAQSAYATTHPDSARRFMSGFAAALTPRGVPGLEVGISRFFHTPWPSGGLRPSHFTKPIELPLKSWLTSAQPGETPNSDADNQLASLFFRLVLPTGGFEVYGEYAREDHSWDLRDLMLQPDHAAGFVVGARKVWDTGAGITSLRAEVLNTQRSHLAQVRNQTWFYTHSSARQGHTHGGQVLGTVAANGGAGATVALDRYTTGGRWTMSWSRALLQELRGSHSMGSEPFRVRHALAAEVLRFVGGVELGLRISPAVEFNRTPGDDAFNLQGRFTVAAPLR